MILKTLNLIILSTFYIVFAIGDYTNWLWNIPIIILGGVIFYKKKGGVLFSILVCLFIEKYFGHVTYHWVFFGLFLFNLKHLRFSKISASFNLYLFILLANNHFNILIGNSFLYTALMGSVLYTIALNTKLQLSQSDYISSLIVLIFGTIQFISSFWRAESIFMNPTHFSIFCLISLYQIKDIPFVARHVYLKVFVFCTLFLTRSRLPILIGSGELVVGFFKRYGKKSLPYLVVLILFLLTIFHTFTHKLEKRDYFKGIYERWNLMLEFYIETNNSFLWGGGEKKSLALLNELHPYNPAPINCFSYLLGSYGIFSIILFFILLVFTYKKIDPSIKRMFWIIILIGTFHNIIIFTPVMLVVILYFSLDHKGKIV